MSIVVLLCAGAALLLALAAPVPAHAQDTWMHGGISSCVECHYTGGPDNAGCISCHNGFSALPGQTCWQCHMPGQDTSAWRLSAGCSSACHLFDSTTKAYDIDFSHGAAPHDGADYLPCRTCHGASSSIFDPDSSPHHDAVALSAPTCVECHDGTIATAQTSHDGQVCTACHNGMDIPSVPSACNACHSATVFGDSLDCASCHAGEIHNAAPAVGSCGSCHGSYVKHAGQVACQTCHTNYRKFHHDTAGMIAKTCRTCHAKRHAGRSIALAKCAVCHKGNRPTSKPRAQHSSTITFRKTCSACHTLKVHAKAVRPSMTCQSCHKGRFHGAQTIPGVKVCLNCHSSAARHSGGISCVRCHKSAIHDLTPRAF